MIRFFLLALLGTAVPAAHAAGAWAEVKPGMTRQQVIQAIGRPLLSNAGRGLEVWVYDEGANVVFLRNRVDCWTQPRPPAAPAAPGQAARPEQLATAPAEQAPVAAAVPPRPAGAA
jgi:hypothetical protein